MCKELLDRSSCRQFQVWFSSIVCLLSYLSLSYSLVDGHEFNWATMDVSHTVNHLSFGPFLSETAWVVMPPDIAQAVGSLDDKKFLSEVSPFCLSLVPYSHYFLSVL